MQDRIRCKYYIKAWKDYNRIKKLLTLVNEYKSDIEIIKNVHNWLNTNIFYNYKKN